MAEPDRLYLPYPWQQSQWRSLQARRQAGRMPHALLFAGPEGMGKRHLAATLSRGLLCEQPAQDGTGCGRCRSCLLLDAGSHPDRLIVSPAEEGKEIGIQQVRELSGYQALKPQYAGNKVITLEPADRMTVSAANALLKTLEEPTDGTLLLLVSDHAEKLLPTIRSRCQTVVFAPIADDSADAWLRERAPEHSPGALLQVGGGAPLAALALAEEGALERRVALLEQLRGLIEDGADPLSMAEEALSEGPDRMLLWLQSWVSDLIRLRSGGSVGHLRNPDLQGRLQALSERVDLERLYRYSDRLQEARRTLGSAVNARLLIEELLILWSQALVARGR
jgi:DNA polymerase-3 subunit delta'